MTSSSSLYGTTTTQNSSSSNSTSLYGEAGTPIPDSSGNVIVRGDLYVLSGNILTTATTGNIFPANATTINLGLAATAVNIGAASGTTTINNALTAGGTVTAPGADFGNITIAVADDNTITTTTGALKLSSATGLVGLVGADTLYTDQTTFNLLNSPTTVNAFQSATSLIIGETTGTTTIRNALTVLDDITAPGADLGNITVGITNNNTINNTVGDLILSTTTGEVGLVGVDTLYTDQTTFNLLNSPTSVTAFDSATTLVLGQTTGTTTIRNDLTVQGDITADGGDFGLITIGVADDQTITTTSGELRISSATGVVKLQGVDTLYTDTTGSFSLLNAPATVTAFQGATALTIGATTGTTTIRNDLVVQGGITGDSADLGNIQIAVTDNQTIDTTTGELRLGSVSGDVKLVGIDALYTDTTGTFNLLNQPTTVAAFRNATSLSLGEDTGTTTINNDLTVNGTNLNIAQGTTFFYNENNDRLNRPNFQSTLGNTSGVRAIGPNTSGSAIATISAFSSSDLDNGSFINIQARNGGSNQLRIQSGEYTGGTLGTGGSLAFVDSTTVYATVNPSGPTISTDLTTKAYVDALPANITYTIDASTTTGGANFNLVGSDATTDTVKFAGSGATTVTRTDANTITISSTDANTTYTQNASSTTGGANLNLVGSDSTTDTIKFAGGTNVTITATDANTITIDAPVGPNTTYTIDASSTSGGANFNLVGSDSTTDTVKLSGSGATTVSQTSANEITVSSVDTNTTYTQDASSTTGGANLNLVGSDSTTDTIKFAGGTNVTVVATDANTITINAPDTNTTYDFNATSTTGGANLNLVGSDSTTDTVKVSSGTGVTVAQVSGTEVSVAIGQAVGTGDSPSFAGVTGGNISVGVATDNTIASTDTNGNIVLDANGTGRIIFDNIQRLRGEAQATTNNSYAFPAGTLTTITDNNGYSAASSFEPNTFGYGANAQYIHYYGDTLSAQNSAPALNYRAAEGNSVAGVNIPWTGINSVAPSALLSGTVCGTNNFNGYATTGFVNDIATQYQGGGLGTSHVLQLQGYTAENLADGTLTIAAANITGVSSFRAPITNLQVTGTKGQVSFNATTPAIGQAIRMVGTLTGTATGIAGGQDYYIIATNGTTTATLSATPNGAPITTTAGTSTGLTITRCAVTLTLSGQTVFPFGRNALVTVANVTNVTDGTYPVGGLPSLTQVVLGIPHSVAPTLPGTQQLTCPTVTNVGGGFRIRAYPLATTMNPQNRLNIIDHTAAAATYRADSFIIASGAYANTGTTRFTVDSTSVRAAIPVGFPVYTVAGKPASGAVGQQICISDSPTAGGRMAFWDTTNARWSYISDNSAV